jgi:hypothetical protein
MTITVCPDCAAPVSVPVHAREGRCAVCRPIRRRTRRPPAEPRMADGAI